MSTPAPEERIVTDADIERDGPLKAALDAKASRLIFVDTVEDIPPGTPVDRLIVPRVQP